MAIQASTEALLALELFQLSPAAKKSRELMNEQLVEVAMFENEDAHSLSEIATAVLKLLQHAIVFTHDECREALTRCCSKGRISQVEGDSYTLTAQTINNLSKSIERAKQAEKDFDQGLAESVGRRFNRVLDPFAEAVLCKTVKEAIQGIFYQNALRFRRLSDEEADLSGLLEFDSKAVTRLKQKLGTFMSLEPNATVEDTMVGIQWFMGNLNKVQKHYIASLHHRVYYFDILNIDPRLQMIEDKCLKSMRLYLDTNVVIRYLCEGAPRYEPIADVLNMSKKLGVKLLISSKTLPESEGLVEEAKGFSAYLNDPEVSAALRSNPIAMSNPIIEAFLVKRRENPKLNWVGFLSRFSDLEIYLITNDIEVNDDDCGDILADESYPRVRAAIIDAKGEECSSNIVEHDTYNLILIQRLRSIYAATLLGSSVWLATIDTKLPKVDRILRRRYPNPHCRMIDHWGAFLLPFQNVGRFIATDDYISYLASEQLGAIFPEEVLDIRFFNELERADVGLDDILKLDPEIAFSSLADLQQDRESKALLAQIPTVSGKEKESVQREFHERALAIISKRSEQEKERDEREMARLRYGIEDLSERLHKMESASSKDTEKLELVRRKLEATKRELKQYERMPFWQRVKYALRGPGR